MDRRGFLKSIGVAVAATTLPILSIKDDASVQDTGFILFYNDTLIVKGHIQDDPEHIDKWKIETSMEKAIMSSALESMCCSWDGFFFSGDYDEAKRYFFKNKRHLFVLV